MYRSVKAILAEVGLSGGAGGSAPVPPGNPDHP
jgi:hypothetical protein